VSDAQRASQILTRETGQRWMRWRNQSATTCPPWGWFVINGVYVDGMEIVWNGITNDDDDKGVPWTAGFNSSVAVPPGETGLFTVDLPTWCLIEPPTGDGTQTGNDYGLGGFVTYVAPSDIPWALRDKITGSDPDVDRSLQWTGYAVFAIREIPEFNALWNVDNHFRIGFIGSMVYERRGGGEEALPP